MATAAKDQGDGVKRGPPTMVKDDKGRWVKADKETRERLRLEWEAQERDAGEAVKEAAKRHEREGTERERTCVRWALRRPPSLWPLARCC